VLSRPAPTPPPSTPAPAAKPAEPYADKLPVAPVRPAGVTDLPVTEINKPVAVAPEAPPAAG
jgi:hypothetical protein